MESLNDEINTYTDLLEEVQKSAPEFGGLQVSVLSIEGTSHDSVNLSLSGSDASASDKVVGENVDLGKEESAALSGLKLTVALPDEDDKAEVQLGSLSGLASGEEVSMPMGSGPAKVSLKLKELRPKKERLDQISENLSLLKTRKISLRAREAQKKRQVEKERARSMRREQAQSEADGMSESEAKKILMAVGELAWRSRGWALFAATVALLHYNGDYLAM
uniref:Uncharacterized protein n=1 Tax=Pinguiococcus pyrenoidosus TaxID=172671 RepID=A0A7R9U1F3_9STRA|mmetsp:Transcript_11308/g.42213  ORF Transcript_11308/g.42213 Transcript_11308/m.42213 type:complete len:220 (+) Transcript_11308:75-734(+)